MRKRFVGKTVMVFVMACLLLTALTFAAAEARLLRRVLFGMEATGPLTIGLATGCVIVVAFELATSRAKFSGKRGDRRVTGTIFYLTARIRIYRSFCGTYPGRSMSGLIF